MEGSAINKSLLALSCVIQALSGDGPGGATAKPPFRDSKLTHLLKPALDRGAASLTAVVCALRPAAAHGPESASTLHFARRARCVVTRPTVREELSDKDRAKRLEAENAVRCCRRHTKDQDQDQLRNSLLLSRLV